MKYFKTSLHSIATLAMASLAVACSGNDAEQNDNGGSAASRVTLKASITDGGASTRLAFNGQGKAFWQTGDEIGAQQSDGKFVKLTMDSGAGTGSATFSGTANDGVGSYAVYPYSENHSISGSTLTYSLPSSYTYTSVGQTAAQTADASGNSFQAPLWGKIETDGSVAFKHLGGVICFVVNDMPAESGTVTITETSESSKKLCGSFTADLSSETPSISTTSTSTDTEKTVTFTYSGTTAKEKGVFYLPVATGIYNFTVTVANGEETSLTTTHSNISVTRAHLKTVTVKKPYAGDEIEGFTKIGDYTYEKAGKTFVDLGTGILWATMNVGANSPTDYGNYYAWGETETKKGYTESNYTAPTLSAETQYALPTTNDVAYVKWGSSFRMPTYTEANNLVQNCTWTWYDSSNTEYNGVAGCEVKNSKTGAKIFLPFAGYFNGTTKANEGKYGYSWTSTIIDMDQSTLKPTQAACIDFGNGNGGNSEEKTVRGVGAYEGQTVRPVADIIIKK